MNHLSINWILTKQKYNQGNTAKIYELFKTELISIRYFFKRKCYFSKLEMKQDGFKMLSPLALFQSYFSIFAFTVFKVLFMLPAPP